MKILFYQWHSFMNRGIEKALKQMQIDYDVFFYQQTDWERDDGIVSRLDGILQKQEYALVLSVNFAPLVSQVCEDRHIQYVAWVYDDPVHIRDIHAMRNACNRIYFFDRIQAQGYQRQGIPAYHMPLAADIDFMQPGRARAKMQADISLVGKLYQTDYAYYCQPLSEFQRGYLDGILNAQMKVYGGYFLGDMLDDRLLDELNQSYQKASNGKVSITKAELEYMMACEITGRERFLALAMLSKHFHTVLYSTDKEEGLSEVDCKGYADYYTQMPKVFGTSRINLNISLKIIQSGIPLRVFDVLGSGGFLLTNFQPEMAELFEMGEDFVVYESIEDMYAKADYYLRHETEREQIARHGHETVEKYYTFKQQLEKIFKERG